MDFNELYQYYTTALELLFKQGRLFGNKYPNVASGLQLGDSEVNDPDVRRLLESFAFVDARISYNIDQEKNTVLNFLLNSFCPMLVAPTVSATVVCLETNVIKQIHVPKNSEFIVQDQNKNEFRFRIIDDVALQVTKIVEVKLSNPRSDPKLGWMNSEACLIVKFDRSADEQQLRLYVNSDLEFASNLLLGMLKYSKNIKSQVFCYDTGNIIGHIEPKTASELINHMVGDPYYDLYSYATLPNHFCFLDLHFYPSATSKEVTVAIPLNIAISSHLAHNRLLLLNCTTAINLFAKRSEPVRIDEFSEKYSLIADTDVYKYRMHMIKKLYIYNPSDGTEVSYEPVAENYFTLLNHDFTEMSVFLNNNFKYSIANKCTIYADLLCSNGEINSIGQGTIFTIENMNYVKGAMVLNPTSFRQSDNLDKWSLLRLLKSNCFMDYMKSGLLKEFAVELLKLYSINTHDMFQSITHETGLGMIKDGWKGVVVKNIFKIRINTSTRNAVVLSIIIAKIMNRLGVINILNEVQIQDEHGQDLVTIGDEFGHN